jgi:hypothetical protein
VVYYLIQLFIVYCNMRDCGGHEHGRLDDARALDVGVSCSLPNEGLLRRSYLVPDVLVNSLEMGS